MYGVWPLSSRESGRPTNVESAITAALSDSSELVRRSRPSRFVKLAPFRLSLQSSPGNDMDTASVHGRRICCVNMVLEAAERSGLIALLLDRHINWRSHHDAADALAAIGDAAVPWHLLHAFTNGPAVLRHYAAVALKQIDKTPELSEAIEVRTS